MTITPMQMYWITTLDSIVIGCVIIGAILFFAGCALFEDTEGWSFIGSALGLVLLVAAIFTPSTKQMAAILIIPKIVNNEKVQGLPDKVMGLADAWIEDLKPENRPAK